MRIALLCLTVLWLGIFPREVSATVLDTPGYTAGSDGYYYHSSGNGVRYTRSLYTQAGYWATSGSYGCCGYSRTWVPAYDFYVYSPYGTVTKTTYAEQPYDVLKAKLLDIAAQRDKFEGQMRRLANEHNAFLETVRELGLSGNFYWSNYGVAPAYPSPARPFAQSYAAQPGYGNLQAGNFGVNGNTVYGYTYSSVADLYGGTDVNVLYQQANALAKNAQDLGGQATAQFSTLVDKEIGGRERVAAQLAQGQSAALALQAARPANRVVTQETVTGSTPAVIGAGGQPVAAAGGGPAGPRRLAAVARCVSCHGEANARGGYRVAQHWSLSPARQRAVVQRLVTEDHDQRMPRLPGGGPAPRLPAELIMEFLPVQDQQSMNP